MQALRLFLDSNVVHSASRSTGSPLHAFWDVPQWKLLTSAYSIDELARNCESYDQRERLNRLLIPMKVVSDPGGFSLPLTLQLPAKDIPIFMAAQVAGADFLITGDKSHFGRYFGETHGGVTIMEPMPFLRMQSGAG